MNILLAILILTIYTLYVIRLGGSIPPSLSESIFTLPVGKHWIWTAVLVPIAFLCVPTIIDKSSENTQFLAFIAIGAFAFVGAAPLCKFRDNELQFNVHEKAAIICGVSSQILLLFNNPLLLLLWIPFLVSTIKIGFKQWKTKLFWGEIVCFVSIFIFCLL